MKQRSCVVIGAGLAGLSAAYALVKRKWEVTVLEAREWTGGRVYSFRFPQAAELVCELGGEWVGKDHNAVIGLCKELGVNLMWHRFDFSFVTSGRRGKRFRAGDWPFSGHARREYDELKRQAKRWGRKKRVVLDKKDWWTILRDRGFTEDEFLRRDLMDSTDFGESIREVGGYSAATEYFDSNKYDEMDFKIEGGNIELVKALERAIIARQGKILTSYPVTEIVQRNRRVVVRTKNCGTFPAKYCICTVPARTLTNISFHPKLPDEQWDAAKQLQYARIMKTAILCTNRFWMDSKNTKFSCFTDATSDFLFDATLSQEGGKGILCSYAIGDKADDLAANNVPALKAKLKNDLQNIFPGAPIKIIEIQRQPWQLDHFTQGAYALYRARAVVYCSRDPTASLQESLFRR